MVQKVIELWIFSEFLSLGLFFVLPLVGWCFQKISTNISFDRSPDQEIINGTIKGASLSSPSSQHQQQQQRHRQQQQQQQQRHRQQQKHLLN